MNETTATENYDLLAPLDYDDDLIDLLAALDQD